MTDPNKLREISLRVGKTVAAKEFEKRGNKSEVHLKRRELELIVAAVFEIAVERTLEGTGR